MALRSIMCVLRQGLVANPATLQLQRQAPRQLLLRAKSTEVNLNPETYPSISSVISAAHNTLKVIFDDHKTADFKYIWLRDNCKCEECVHPQTRQKLLDSPSLNVSVKPKALSINDKGQLAIQWEEEGQIHHTNLDASWLYRYGQCFMHETFEPAAGEENLRPPMVFWDRTTIWKSFPEISYHEVMESEDGVKMWLELIYKYGMAVMRGVPVQKGKIVDVVKRFAYVKETQYGQTFDVISEPDPQAHLAYTGKHLHYHTDLNYREKSPGLQLLHCLKAEDPRKIGIDPGGMSFFTDGFRAARWMEDNEPSAFHILTSTPVRFQIKNIGHRYSQLWPIICLNQDGDIVEVHCNNRTMGPLQVPGHVVVPFYHAYKLFTVRLRDPSSELKFHMLPGDLVAFNNRRVLHGRSSFDPSLVSRHLEGCYVDIDEAFSTYDLLLSKGRDDIWW